MELVYEDPSHLTSDKVKLDVCCRLILKVPHKVNEERRIEGDPSLVG